MPRSTKRSFRARTALPGEGKARRCAAFWAFPSPGKAIRTPRIGEGEGNQLRLVDFTGAAILGRGRHARRRHARSRLARSRRCLVQRNRAGAREPPALPTTATPTSGPPELELERPSTSKRDSKTSGPLKVCPSIAHISGQKHQETPTKPNISRTRFFPHYLS